MQVAVRCPVCEGKKTLWLGGSDRVECPQCNATGLMKFNEYRVNPIESKSFFMSSPIVVAKAKTPYGTL